MALLLICGVLLLALSWNSHVEEMPSPALMVMIWVLLSASGIYLFLLAVKKAHRLMVEEERSKLDIKNTPEKRARKNESSEDQNVLDFTTIARKLVRRIDENASLEETGKELLQHLSKELEIMSGVFYIEKKGLFEAVSSFALNATEEPYSFKLGEGLTGQVARNQQLMVLTRLPEGHLEVYSGLGKAEPAYLGIVPLLHKNRTVAVLECSGYRYNPQDIESFLRILARDLMEKLSPNL
jgi:hypothetical protein